MKTKVLTYIGTAAAVCFFAYISLDIYYWYRSLPEWELSVDRTDDGSVVAVSKAGCDKATYRVIVSGWKVSEPFPRTPRTKLTSREVVTTSFDDDVPPGQWAIMIAGNKINIMPAFLIVNDSLECKPGETLVIKGD